TGVFADSVRQMDKPDASEMIAPSQGIHLVLDQRFLGGETAIMIPNTDDGRVLFAIPWENRMLLGTTDTGGVVPEICPRPMQEEVDYLIDHAGRYLVAKPTHADIRSMFAGLRPLVVPNQSQSQSTSKISRSHSLTVSDSGLVTMAGGKWTTYRQMAEDAVDRVIEVGGFDPRPCSTHDLKLLAEESIVSEKIHPELPCTLDDVDSAVNREMALTLDDVLSRRTRSLLLDAKAARKIAPAVCQQMAGILGKGDDWVARELKEFEQIALAYSEPTSHKESVAEPDGS
ncbi:MAG: FAD-dependent oxidoreductase, partial [Verrucomicrobiota bacterium]